MPDARRRVESGRNECAPIRRERDAAHLHVVAQQEPAFLAVFHAPETDRLVQSRRGQEFAVGADRQGEYGTGVADQSAHFLPGGRTQDADGGNVAAIHRCRRHQIPVGSHGHGGDCVAMVGKRPDQSGTVGGPDLRGPVVPPETSTSALAAKASASTPRGCASGGLGSISQTRWGSWARCACDLLASKAPAALAAPASAVVGCQPHTFHHRSFPSSPPVTRKRPLGLKARQFTSEACASASVIEGVRTKGGSF